VPEEVGRYILSFLDVPTLVQKKAVCRSWKEILTNTIVQKSSPPKPFQSRTELKEAVDKYLEYNIVDAEEFAQTYGWPIDRWDVSHVECFSLLFYEKKSFNENIGSWDVSNVTNMHYMFCGASEFNQDVSSWNVANVTQMGHMFHDASEFNQDVSSWNVSSGVHVGMSHMFIGTRNLNQDLCSWGYFNALR
jgi:surface protein